LLIEIDGEEMSTEGSNLYIDGVHALPVLEQLREQYAQLDCVQAAGIEIAL
jgi:hypothetical protein